MSANHDTHTLSLVDIPLVRRLSGSTMMLDTRIGCTAASAVQNSTLLASILPYTSRYTLVARANNQPAVGQFFITPDGQHARIVYMAPHLPANIPDDAWLLALDGMVREAGRHGAHTLTAEVDEGLPLFETMRHSGFAVYARQQLWYRPPGPPHMGLPEIAIEATSEQDMPGIISLYSRVTPRLLQQVGIPPDHNGFLYREADRVMAYINVAEGRDGLYLMPYIDPAVLPIAEQIIAAAVLELPRIDRLPVTVRVRRHQGWLGAKLEDMGFEQHSKQAVMVRHIAAGVHTPGFTSVEEKVATSPTRPEHAPEICIATHRLRKITLSPGVGRGRTGHGTFVGCRVPDHPIEQLVFRSNVFGTPDNGRHR